MNKRNLIITVVVAILAIGAVPFVYAQGHMRGHGGPDGFGALGRLAHAKEQLGLSDQQVTEIKAIMGDLRQQNQPLREQLHGGMQSIVATLVQNPNDVAAAQSLIDQQSQAERTMKTNLLNAASKALNVLTPDQRAKLGKMVAEHQARHRSAM